MTRFKGHIEWDASQPEEQPRRCQVVKRAEHEFGFCARIRFDDGLLEAIEWYRNSKIGRVSQQPAQVLPDEVIQLLGWDKA
jgi:nucleoside-diphosphate-sugar epimerase